MRSFHIIVLFIISLCSACSVSVAPLATATGTIDPVEKSITEIRDGVSFTVKLDELHVAPYQMVDNIAAFHVAIDNLTMHQVLFPPQAFILKDDDGNQYHSISPERVKEIVSRDTVYLIPHPYVGYYYLDDQAMVTSTDTFSSSLPFYAEYHPQDIFTHALPEEPILNNSKVAGLVYFIADLERANYLELLLFSDAKTSGEPLVKFPFSVNK